MEKKFITAKNIEYLKFYLNCLNVEQALIDSINVESANEILMEDIRNHFDHLIK